MISFIHIGKCGGTTVHHLIKDKIDFFKQYHLNKKYTNYEKYIIWIRNPLSRFVSAFNFQKECVNYDVTTLIGKEISLNTCIAPICFKFKLKSGYTYNKKYDSLISFFKSPNDLAESLTHDDPIIKNKAIELMSFPIQHLSRGIGWYLNNGNFVKNNNSNILFVGKLETMTEDIIKLQTILNTSLDTTAHLRKNNKGDTFLSELAIQNLLEWYKDTDYKAINELHINGWITKETLESYYKYENKI